MSYIHAEMIIDRGVDGNHGMWVAGKVVSAVMGLTDISILPGKNKNCLAVRILGNSDRGFQSAIEALSLAK